MITLTPTAVGKVKEILDSQEPKPSGLRIAVVGGGCSGFSYSMAFENTPGLLDKAYELSLIHIYPDVWTWGVRQTLQRMREELDKVNPNAVLFTEGEADIAREFVDGFVSHSHSWGHGEFTEPLVRFLYPDMRAYESWGDVYKRQT